MLVGVPKETFPGERRVALVPANVPLLAKAGLDVIIESGAGEAAGYPDAAYLEKGAGVVSTRKEVFAAEILLQVRGPGANPVSAAEDLPRYHQGQVVIAYLDPLSAPETMQKLAETGVAAFSLELLPRITRAQSMDTLSSMATVAGYKIVLLAANELPKMFPMLMTAAGTLAPARVFVVGVGVAGLMAIATARRLGAVVEAYDIRPAVKEQVLSLGAKFVDLELDTSAAEDKGGYARAMDEEFYRKQREMMLRVVAESDVVITTAAVPGRKAPILVTEEMVRGMRPGSVIADLAAERGGNCELTRPGETVEVHGVKILGPVNLASQAPYHASQMFSKNIVTFLLNMLQDGRPDLDKDDEIVRETLVTRNGAVVHQRVRELLGEQEPPAADESPPAADEAPAADAGEAAPVEASAPEGKDDQGEAGDAPPEPPTTEEEAGEGGKS